MKIGQIRRFTKTDWYGYAGAEKFNASSDPIICEGTLDDCDITIIADKNGVSVDLFCNKGLCHNKEVTYCWDLEDLNALRALGCMGRIRNKFLEINSLEELIYFLEKNDNFRAY